MEQVRKDKRSSYNRCRVPRHTPARGPSLRNSTGRQRLSSCRRLEFWKCATIAFLPWMRAYVMLQTCRTDNSG